MKSVLSIPKIIRNGLVVLFLSIISLASFAQDNGGGVSVSINKDGGGSWYSHPWVWVIGAAIFILLLVALLRGGSNKD